MRIIDLTLPVDNQMRGVDVSPFKRLETDGWNATTLTLYSHCGTHMDAPFHFLPGGNTIDQQDLSPTVGPAIVVDVAPAEPRQLLSNESQRAGQRALCGGQNVFLKTCHD